MLERPFEEQQRIAQAINELQPTGDLLSDINTLAGLVGSSLYDYFTNPTTRVQTADPKNAEAIYANYTSPESQAKMDEASDDPVVTAHVAALKRILVAYEKASGR